MIRVPQIKLSISEDIGTIPQKVAKKLRMRENDILEVSIYKESIDARKGEVKRVYTVDVLVRDEAKLLKANKALQMTPDYSYKPASSGTAPMGHRPVVIGFGPAGMFAGLVLAQAGYRPIILERGGDVDTRTQDVHRFWESGVLNPESNVQFGEGGAGTFSDGKLTTRIKDPRCRKVLEELVEAGAPDEILYKNKPHVGTDKLKPTVKAIREKILALGGDVRFNTRVTGLKVSGGSLKGIELADGTELETSAAVLAVGHSARDVFEMLYEAGVSMQAKPFAVGVRIEHPQDMIDRVQYSAKERPEGLGAAEYRLTYQTSAGRAVYTFCMCPGGFVVASSSEPERLVVNGMSEYDRAQKNANSALLVAVTPADFPSQHPLSGVKFQRELEHRAYLAGGADYSAPVQSVGDFLEGRRTQSISTSGVIPSYTPGVRGADFTEIFPPFVIEAMREALVEMDSKLSGFARPDAVLTAVESRSSSPVRIHRDEDTLSSSAIEGLYPCGEGAGYAGGIMSSAVDGIKVAESIIKTYANEGV